MEYAKAFWAAATAWRTRDLDARDSRRVNAEQAVMLICLETCGDHARHRDLCVATANIMFNLRCSGGGRLWPSLIPHSQCCLLNGAEETSVL